MSKHVFTTDLELMEAELAWVEARCRRLVAEKELSERAADDSDVSRGFRDPMTPKQARSRLRRARAREDAAREAVERGRGNPELGLERLCAMYALTERERTALVLAAATAFSRRFAQLYSDLGDHFGLSVETLFAFLELSTAERVHARRMFRRDGPLLAQELVVLGLRERFRQPEELLDASLSVTSRTFRTLVGDACPQDELLDFSSLELPQATLDQVVLDPADKARILAVVDGHEAYLARRAAWGFDEVIRYGRGAVLLFHGPPGTGKTMTAHGLADHIGKRLLNVDIPTFLDHAEGQHFLPALFREARLQDAVLFFDECEALFASRRYGNQLMNVLLTELERFDGVAILATNAPDALDEALERRLLVRVAFPRPDRAARRQIWERLLPAEAPIAADVDLDQLAHRFDLAGGYIKNAVLMAVASVTHAGRDRIAQADLVEAARQQRERVSDGDGEALAVPMARLADVVLGAEATEAVEEIVEAARHRSQALERWGIGTHLTGGRGVVALFHGPPGTGKTLCAEAIAGELGRPLLPCTLSGVLSKYVGESEQRLSALFDQARRREAVLFVDEADAWLGDRRARSEAHDRRLVNLLLLELERHEGVVLMATNLAGGLDAALARRLGWTVRFDLPDVAARAAIWRRLLPPGVPGADAIDVEQLAAGWRLTGAAIRNAVYRAAFRAERAQRPLTTEALARAAAEASGAPRPAPPLLAAADA